MLEAETRATVSDGVGRIELNRPQVLNALSPTQFHELDLVLRRWRDDDAVRLVIISGAGDRAFSAGGDIRAVWDARLRGDDAFNRAIFRDEYRLDRLIHHYPKPYVALLDGIVMGGGAGVSVNGRWRVATERTLFAMPETAIGFFPDVGASHFLSRCPGRVGLYLGLTGARLGPADCLWTGLATHFVPAARLPVLEAALAEPGASVPDVLAAFHGDPGPSPLAEIAPEIETCFGAASLGEALAALERSNDEWARRARAGMAAAAPVSLAVTWRQLTTAKNMDFDDAIRREFHMACRFLEGADFYEGIRALVVDKDKSPRWTSVSDDLVAAHFALGDEEPLAFGPP